MIKDYIDTKTGKKMYEIVGEYIGKRPNGKEKRVKKKGFTSKKAAKDYIFKVKQEFETNNSILPENVTFSQLWDLWYETKRHKIIDASKYVLDIQKNVHIFPFLGNVAVKKITTLFLQKHFNDHLSPKYSTASMQLTRVYIKSVLEYAVDLDLISKNPARKLIVPKKPGREGIFLEREVLGKMLEFARKNLKKIRYAFVRLLAMTGARKGEIGALKWTDIDFVNHTINIYKTVTNNRDGKSVYGITTKTIASKRVLSIDEITINLLKEIRREAKILSEFIFTITDYKSMVNEVKKCGKAIGIEKLAPHDLRHTHATLLCEANVDIKTVQHRMGHSNIKTTLAIYAKVTRDQKANVIDTFVKHIS